MNLTEILHEFKSHNLNIIDESKLIEYIDFCISHNQNNKIMYKTAHHHILPQAVKLPFGNFSDLKSNPWNGVHLLHKDHYDAHFLLCQSIEHYSIVSSFYAMNNKDLKNKRLDKNDMVSEDVTELLLRDRTKLVTAEYLLNGEYTSIAKEVGKKASITKRKGFIKDGNLTTIAKESGKKRTATNNGRAITVVIYNINNEVIEECNGTFFAFCKIHSLDYTSLKNASKDSRLFKTNLSKARAINQGKEKFIGCYTETK